MLATSSRLPRAKGHSCSPSQSVSMLRPDFAAVRQFFNYRFPHVAPHRRANVGRAPDGFGEAADPRGLFARLFLCQLPQRPMPSYEPRIGRCGATKCASVRRVRPIVRRACQRIARAHGGPPRATISRRARSSRPCARSSGPVDTNRTDSLQSPCKTYRHGRSAMERPLFQGVNGRARRDAVASQRRARG